MISDYIKCTDSTDPEVVNETNGAMIGRKAPKYFFLCTGKLRGRGGLRTIQMLGVIGLLETIESQTIILILLFSHLLGIILLFSSFLHPKEKEDTSQSVTQNGCWLSCPTHFSV